MSEAAGADLILERCEMYRHCCNILIVHVVILNVDSPTVSSVRIVHSHNGGLGDEE